MIGDVKGYVITDKEFNFTNAVKPIKIMQTIIDEEQAEEMNQALLCKMIPIWSIAVDESSYLVFATTKSGFQFLWDIDKRDTIQFIKGDIIKQIKQEQQFNHIVETLGIEDIEAFKDFLNNSEIGKALKVVMDAPW